MKTIDFNFYRKDFKLALALNKYATNDRLYVGIIDMGDMENFNDLTINIPNVDLKDNEIVINGDLSIELANTLYKLGIIKRTRKNAYSGFGTYDIAIFNEEVAKDYILTTEDIIY